MVGLLFSILLPLPLLNSPFIIQCWFDGDTKYEWYCQLRGRKRYTTVKNKKVLLLLSVIYFICHQHFAD